MFGSAKIVCSSVLCGEDKDTIELVLGLPSAAGHLALESNITFIGNLYVFHVTSPVGCWLKCCAVGAWMLLVYLVNCQKGQLGMISFRTLK